MVPEARRREHSLEASLVDDRDLDPVVFAGRNTHEDPSVDLGRAVPRYVRVREARAGGAVLEGLHDWWLAWLADKGELIGAVCAEARGGEAGFEDQFAVLRMLGHVGVLTPADEDVAVREGLYVAAFAADLAVWAGPLLKECCSHGCLIEV